MTQSVMGKSTGFLLNVIQTLSGCFEIGEWSSLIEGD
jgi:hypothetical protein